jgi:MerR family transcriptional regulator, thiopeptide resistance regulator
MTTIVDAGGQDRTWRVGELAVSTGLSVRALHYYDQVGLLKPSHRSQRGHRRYNAADVARLYRISLLRRLGFPLHQISAVLEDPEWQLGPAINRHMRDTQTRAAVANRLCTRLGAMKAELARQDNPSPEQLFATLEEMTMLDNATIHGTTQLLVYDDLAAARDYLVQVFGLSPGEVERDTTGRVVHAEVRAGDRAIWLHPAGEEYRSPRSLGGVSSMTVIAVEDADAHYARTVEAGGQVIKEPVDQPYGQREYGARDPEGQLWYFQSPLG